MSWPAMASVEQVFWALAALRHDGRFNEVHAAVSALSPPDQHDLCDLLLSQLTAKIPRKSGRPSGKSERLADRDKDVGTALTRELENVPDIRKWSLSGWAKRRAGKYKIGPDQLERIATAQAAAALAADGVTQPSTPKAIINRYWKFLHDPT